MCLVDVFIISLQVQQDIFKMRKLLLSLIFGLFLFSLISAESDLGTFKKGECVNLYQLCDNCSYVNLTSITYPNSTTTTLNNAMIKNGVDYSYSFCYTMLEGNYFYKVCGNKGGTFQCETIKFSINPSGTKSISVLNNTALIILLGLASLLIFCGIYFSITSLGFIGSLFFILAGVYTVIYGFGDVTNIYSRGAGIGILALGLFFMFISAYEGFGVIKEEED